MKKSLQVTALFFVLLFSLTAVAASTTTTKNKRSPSSSTGCDAEQMVNGAILFQDSKERVWVALNERMGKFFVATGMTALGPIVPGKVALAKVVNLGPCPTAQFNRTYKIKGGYIWTSQNTCNDEWAGFLKGEIYDPSEGNYGSMEAEGPTIYGKEIEVCTDGNRLGTCSSLAAGTINNTCMKQLFF